MTHDAGCDTNWDPDRPCSCRSRNFEEDLDSVNKQIRWENSRQLDEDSGLLIPTSHAPDCPAGWEPDHTCTCGFGK